jgi:hypothetical protein
MRIAVPRDALLPSARLLRGDCQGAAAKATKTAKALHHESAIRIMNRRVKQFLRTMLISFPSLS